MTSYPQSGLLISDEDDESGPDPDGNGSRGLVAHAVTLPKEKQMSSSRKA